MSDTPKTLEDWEADGAMRFLHGDKIPYPTRDKCSEAEELAFARGFRKEELKAHLKKEQNQELE